MSKITADFYNEIDILITFKKFQQSVILRQQIVNILKVNYNISNKILYMTINSHIKNIIKF